MKTSSDEFVINVDNHKISISIPPINGSGKQTFTLENTRRPVLILRMGGKEYAYINIVQITNVISSSKILLKLLRVVSCYKELNNTPIGDLVEKILFELDQLNDDDFESLDFFGEQGELGFKAVFKPTHLLLRETIITLLIEEGTPLLRVEIAGGSSFESTKPHEIRESWQLVPAIPAVFKFVLTKINEDTLLAQTIRSLL